MTCLSSLISTSCMRAGECVAGSTRECGWTGELRVLVLGLLQEELEAEEEEEAGELNMF